MTTPTPPGPSPTPGDEKPGLPPSPPSNPLYSGVIGVSSVVIAIAGCLVFVVFLALDTVQFIKTGHESGFFTTVAHASGAVGVTGLIATLVKTYIQPRSK